MLETSSRIVQELRKNKKASSLAALFAVLLLLRSQSIGRRRRSKSLSLLPKCLSPEEIANVEQQLYIEGDDGTPTLLIPFRGRVEKASILPVPLCSDLSFRRCI